MTRPITAVATVMLADEGQLDLNEDVTRLLPELANPRVLRRLDGPIDDTVPAEREITIHDLLTFRSGFGMILDDPARYPILQATDALQLCTGPPIPVTPHTPDEWIRRLGELPLMHQPGTHWRYSTPSQILGVLIARASGQDLPTFFRNRIFDPLDMTNTGFTAIDPTRLVEAKEETTDGITRSDDGDTWLSPRVFPDGGAGLVSTAADYLRFGRMLMNGGKHDGQQLVSAELIEQMTTNHLTDEQRTSADVILDGRGWGYGLSITDQQTYGWDGGFGTHWLNDPARDLVVFIGHQVGFGPAVFALLPDIWAAIHASL
jgi:CubicO group peptidase (beta-lactamase class C family)